MQAFKGALGGEGRKARSKSALLGKEIKKVVEGRGAVVASPTATQAPVEATNGEAGVEEGTGELGWA